MSSHPGVTGRKSGQADPVLTEHEYAEYVGLSLSTVRRQRDRGELEYIQLSENRIGYRQSYADRRLEQRTVRAKAVQP